MSVRADSIRARRPGPRAWAALIRAEGRMVTRDFANLLLPIGLPLLVLLTSATMAGSEEIPDTGFTAFELFVLPIVLTMVLAYIGLMNMPIFLASYRKTGVLRRLGVTPASPAMVLVAQVVVTAAQSLVGIALALAVSFAFFDARMPASVLAVAGVFVLVMIAMYAIGMIIASLAPSANAAIGGGVIAFLGLGALGGLFGGRQALPGPLQEVSPHLPFGAAADALGAAWAGTPIPPESLISLAAATVIGLVVSLLWFRWE